MAQALKAVAANEGRKLKAHWEIGDGVRETIRKLLELIPEKELS